MAGSDGTPDALERLRADHQVVLRRLDSWQGRLASAEDFATPAARREVGEFLDFVQDEVWNHFRREEEALFPALRNLFPENNAPVAGGPVFVLSEEHVVLRKLVSRLAEELRKWDAGEPDAPEAARLGATQLTRAFHKHIYKEDNIVFRLAESTLSPEDRAALNEAFEAASH